jgi:Septum formation
LATPRGGCPSARGDREPLWGGKVGGAALAVVLVIAALAVPLSDDNTPDGQSVYWEDLQPGMCVRILRIPGDPYAMDYTVVDCSAEHEEEVTSSTTLAGSQKWPGDDAVDKAAEKKCKSAFASYVGLGRAKSRLDQDFLTVDQDGWTDGDFTLICLVLDPDNDHLTRSLRGAHK